MLALERIANEAPCCADLAAAIILVENALDDPSQRAAVIHYLTAYLLRCLVGVVPDPSIWLP